MPALTELCLMGDFCSQTVRMGCRFGMEASSLITSGSRRTEGRKLADDSSGVKSKLMCGALQGNLLFASRRFSNGKCGHQFVKYCGAIGFVGVQWPVGVVSIDDS